jgi:hypothetical protein
MRIRIQIKSSSKSIGPIIITNPAPAKEITPISRRIRGDKREEEPREKKRKKGRKKKSRLRHRNRLLRQRAEAEDMPRFSPVLFVNVVDDRRV